MTGLLIREGWRSFWFEPSRPFNLALCRVLFFSAFFLYYLPQDFSAWGDVSKAFWSPIWIFDLLALPILPGYWLLILQRVWKLALLASCFGLLTRPATVISFLLGFYLIGLPHSFGKVHHSDTIIVLALAIFALSRCGDAVSLDGVIRAARTSVAAADRRRSGEYTWPIRLVWVLMSLIYLGAGVSKLSRSGLDWVFSDNLALLLITHQYHISNADPLTSWGLAVAQYPLLSRSAAAATVVLELLYPLGLFSVRARWILVPSGFVMQLAIRVLMGPAFEQYLICNLFWMPWDRLVHGVKRQCMAREKLSVFFDGACGICQTTVAVIRRLDVLGKVAFYDVRNGWLRTERKFPSLRQDRCLTEIHVIAPGGHLFTSFYGYRALARVLPVGWLLLPLLYIPGVPNLGTKIYQAVASYRHQSGCPLHAADAAPESAAPTSPDRMAP